MNINTSKFKNIINKAIKACSNNKLFPLTSLVSVNVFGDGFCGLVTYDSTNLLSVGDYDVYEVSNNDYTDGLVLEAVVSASQLCALVNKLSTPTINFAIKDGNLVVTSGRNSYKLPMFYEEGAVVQFPVIDIDVSNAESTTINVDSLKLALKHNESCAAKTYEVPSLVNAYFGKMIVTSDSIRACFTNVDVFKREVLLPYSFLKLVNVFDDEFINVVIEGDKILLYTNDCSTSLMGNISDDLESFPIEVLSKLLEVENTNVIRLVKKELVSCLERFSIFDENVLNVSIKNNQITFRNGDSAVETLELSNASDFEFNVALSSFLPLVRETDGEVINIAYGSNIGVSIINFDENENNFVTRILAFITNE